MQKNSIEAVFVMLACWLGLSSGCWNSQEGQVPQNGNAARSSAAKKATLPVVTLQLLVVDDPELAGAVKKLRGEWTERTGGGQLQVLQWTAPELVAAENLSVDLVVYPARYLGTLVEKSWLRPLRDSVLRSEQFAKTDLLAAIRGREISYGGRVYAFPFGSPPLLLCYNSQVLNAAGCEVPQTWDDYRAVVRRLNRQSMPCQLPLAGESAAITLLSRSVSYAHDGGPRVLLFDLNTFQPRIAEPPFVRALEEIVAEVHATMEFSKVDRIQGEAVHDALHLWGYQNAVKEVALGQSAMTLGWPGADGPQRMERGPSDANLKQKVVHYAPLPRAKTVYRSTQKQWETNRVDTPRTLLGIAGRLASVTTTSRNAVSAFKLLRWLGSGDTAIEISSSSRFTLWYRHSQVEVAERWQTNCQGQAVAVATATGPMAERDHHRLGIGPVVIQALSSDDCFLLPRIPGIDQYLEGLGQAVRSAIAGESATTVLLRATTEWEIVTDRLGREKQRSAYRAHLDL